MEKEVKKVKKVNQEKLINSITEKIVAALEAKKEIKSDIVSDKKEKITPEVKIITESSIKLYRTKAGKDIVMPAKEAEDVGNWFKSLLRRDYAGMNSYYQKLEPLIEGTAGEGGNLVPVVLYNALVPLMEEKAVIKPLSTVINMSGMKTNQLDISGIASKPVVQWGSENTAKATSSMTFNKIALTPYLLAAIVPFSMQLRDDSPFNIVQLITKALGESYVKAEEKAFATGSGAGRPTGINTYTAGATISAANNLSFDHLNSAYWRMPQAYRENAVWLMNGRTIEVVSALKDSQNRPLLLENGIFTESGMPTVKGRPVYEQNDLESTSIFFVDLSQYYIGEKLPMTIDIADQAVVAGVSLWERNLLAIRIEGRVDGELVTTRAMTEINQTGVA